MRLQERHRCSADGRTSEIIFNLGPGRLGDLLESIAIPELRQQAVELASTLVDRMRPRYAFHEVTTGIARRELIEERVAV